MTFTARTDIAIKALVLPHPTNPGMEPGPSYEPSAVYELDTLDLVAVYYSAKRTQANTLSCHIVAWMVDAEGDAQSNIDYAGVPIMVEFKHNASPSEVRTLGGDGLAQLLIDLVMGTLPEGPGGPAIQWSHEILDQVNIVNAIMVAKATGPIADMFALTGN